MQRKRDLIQIENYYASTIVVLDKTFLETNNTIVINIILKHDKHKVFIMNKEALNYKGSYAEKKNPFIVKSNSHPSAQTV